MSGKSKSHDAVLRRVLGKPENAASELRAVLPSALVKRLDLDQLARVAGDFVDARLSSRYSDLVFSVPLDGRKAFVYVLIEHQSSTDGLMPYRMLEYIVRIWDQYLTDEPTATRLPAVIPLVVHQDGRPWSGPTELADLIDLDPDTAEMLAGYLPRFQFMLDDLAVVDEQALRQQPLTPDVRFTFVLVKAAPGHTHLVDVLRGWDDEVRAMLDVPGGKEILRVLVEYIGRVAETPEDELREWFAHVGPDAEEIYMTTAEMIYAKGEAKGVTRGQAKTLLRLLDIRFGPLSQATVDTVSNATVEQLDDWTARIVTAATLHDVLD